MKPVTFLALGSVAAVAGLMWQAQQTAPPTNSLTAYGIVAFARTASEGDMARYRSFCDSFASAANNDTARPITVWPLRQGATEPCAQAVAAYDFETAETAIEDARRAGVALEGNGPFLLVWAPATDKGKTNATVLAADLGAVENAGGAQDALALWQDKIMGNPALWQNGLTTEKLGALIERHGNGTLKLFGG